MKTGENDVEIGENDVEIGANTCIDKGTLGNTIIKANAKIDNLVVAEFHC